MKFLVQPGGEVGGTIRVPGDKSISHRSIMLGSIAEGTTRVTGFLRGADSLATLSAFRAMGVAISDPHDGALEISGVGMRGLQAASAPLDLGNSGTSMRLLAGLLAGQAFDSTLIGDASLSKRPMARVAAPLSLMGAVIDTAPGGTPPLHVRGGKQLVGIRCRWRVPRSNRACCSPASMRRARRRCSSRRRPATTPSACCAPLATR